MIERLLAHDRSSPSRFPHAVDGYVDRLCAR
jgi:hypothetical protein